MNDPYLCPKCDRASDRILEWERGSITYKGYSCSNFEHAATIVKEKNIGPLTHAYRSSKTEGTINSPNFVKKVNRAAGF